MKMNDKRTTNAPTQYSQLEYCPDRNICPIKLSGIVRLNPTVTRRGEVNSIASAHEMSETRDADAFV
jgi:hypothetical protein